MWKYLDGVSTLPGYGELCNGLTLGRRDQSELETPTSIPTALASWLDQSADITHIFLPHLGEWFSNVWGSVPTLLLSVSVSCSTRIADSDLIDKDANGRLRTSCARIDFQPFARPPF
ncbi:hypothetical protein FRC00_001178, partial [Tulasnella sp. 408]